jgi:hypothetical protein
MSFKLKTTALMLMLANAMLPDVRTKHTNNLKLKAHDKLCLQCGEPHTHNNICCSAKCFKEYSK